MKKQFKSALVAIAVSMAATGAHAVGYNNDLIIGFSGGGSANDLMYDLGAPASLFNGEQWTLTSLLGSFNLSTVNWGVIGNTSATQGNRNVFVTSSVNPGTINSSTGTAINNGDGALYSNFTTAGPGNSVSVDPSGDNSWKSQTISPTLATQLRNAYTNPDINRTGTGAFTLWQTRANASAPVQLLDFTLGTDGVLTYGTVAVPEPSTYGFLAGAGLLLVSFRNAFRRKLA